MAIFAMFITMIIILAAFSVIPVIVWLIYRHLYDRHANAALSSGGSGKKWLPPFAVVLMTFAAEFFLLIGAIAMLRVDYGSVTVTSDNERTEVVTGSDEARVIELNFTGYDETYCFGGTWSELYAAEDEIVIDYEDENGDVFEVVYRIPLGDDDSFYGLSDADGKVRVDVEGIDPASVVSVEFRGIDARGEYISAGREFGFTDAS